MLLYSYGLIWEMGFSRRGSYGSFSRFMRQFIDSIFPKCHSHRFADGVQASPVQPNPSDSKEKFSSPLKGKVRAESANNSVGSKAVFAFATPRQARGFELVETAPGRTNPSRSKPIQANQGAGFASPRRAKPGQASPGGSNLFKSQQLMP
jgi:hypothetical protein